MPVQNKPEVDTPHSRNLAILGVLSVSIALITTIVSLVVYHNSGDIYLDRSRPGFLPDEEEVEQQPTSTYVFPDSGPVTEEVLNEYIDHFEENLGNIDDLERPFSDAPLSDESLGIPAPNPSDSPSET